MSMLSFKAAHSLLLAILIVAGCSYTSNEETRPVKVSQPALISNPGATSALVITKAINSLTGAEVLLADNVFAENSYLLIHKKQLLGRDLDEVDHYDLVLSDGVCELIYNNTKQTLLLPELDCVSESLE